MPGELQDRQSHPWYFNPSEYHWENYL